MGYLKRASSKGKALIYRLLDSLGKWKSDSLSIYSFIGIAIINFSLYYLYHSLAPIFSVEELIFLLKVTGEEAFPTWGFLLSIAPPILVSYGVFLSSRSSKTAIRFIVIFIVVLLSLGLALTFLPLSITIFAAYASLAGATSFISIFRLEIEGLKSPFTGNSENRNLVLELRHELLKTILSYSIWTIITVALGGMSVLFLNPLVSRILELGGSRWIFVRGQTILCIGLITYYVIGLFSGTTLVAFRELIKLEESVCGESG